MSESREQVAALAEELAHDIVRTVLVNRRVDEECAVGFARDVLRPRLARALAACALEARKAAFTEAAELCTRDLTNEEDADWNAFDGGFEHWLAKQLLERAAGEKS